MLRAKIGLVAARLTVRVVVTRDNREQNPSLPRPVFHLNGITSYPQRKHSTVGGIKEQHFGYLQ